MSDVKIGVMTEAEFIERPELVEELGFDSIWTGEHVAAPRPTSDGLAVLSYYAGRTSLITLGSGILLVPLRPPVAMAKAITTLDRLSQGRTIIGIGVGGEYPEEFEACGVSVKERGARANEAIEIFRKLWSDAERISHQGRFWSFENIMHAPKPVQPGGPPIWVSGRSDAAIERTARTGDGYLPYLFTADRFRKSVAKVREACDRMGRDVETLTLAYMGHLSIGSDAARALQIAREHLSTRYGANLWDLAPKLAISGTPEDCVNQMGEFIEAGCRHFVFNLIIPEDSTEDEQLRRAAELLPRLKQVAGS